MLGSTELSFARFKRSRFYVSWHRRGFKQIQKNLTSILGWRMPIDIIKERYLTKLNRQSTFTRRSTLFQALVVACMRYGFAYVPTRIGRVFFTKGVALPFLRFRMLRHGYFWHLRHRPLWREINLVGHFNNLGSERKKVSAIDILLLPE